MNKKTVITCAIVGATTSREHTPHLPITPAEIAQSALEAVQAGAAAVHIHVRDPATGKASMEVDLYAEVVKRIRDAGSQVIINLTTGAGARFVPSEHDPRVAGPGTTLVNPEQRVQHILALKPDVATLDLNTMTSRNQVVINTPDMVRKMAGFIQSAGAIPEIELFDSGDVQLANALIEDGTLTGPRLFSFVLGVKYGFVSTPETVLYARNLLPAGAHWTAIGIGKQSFPMVAQGWLMGGHARVGMEDNIYLGRGKLARTNAELVTHAAELIALLGGEVATIAEARAMWGLRAS
ncbi:3-keto-5-aminohexanoate cleavage protein [Hydrogenophaga sp.]|uniref:3-keto-5-aminohexanoate cleavage protein n=1 Tax=Hydrogenophaga sp. TaxID=1904254 RepID=UPI00271AD4D0|nr:3-keto-5-aminohexanoate cleavage protein [Hydrogenophaga sp.]MDO9436990.1 3-keto-5-aminohexanoate cleavage protein [Hydrogenophaga sp.]